MDRLDQTPAKARPLLPVEVEAAPTMTPPGAQPSLRLIDANATTRARVLEAAGEVFSERGFKDATVREICARAGANIAAINYYFQGKDSLYLQVIEYAQQRVQQARPIKVDADAKPEEKLRQFLHSFVARVLDPASPAWHGKLMLREMVEPTAALDKVVNDTIRPTFLALSAIIAELVPGSSEEQIKLCTTSVMGQCLMHRHCEPVLVRLFADQVCPGIGGLERLAEHIYRFSMAGLGAVRAANLDGAKGEGAVQGKHGSKTSRGTRTNSGTRNKHDSKTNRATRSGR